MLKLLLPAALLCACLPAAQGGVVINEISYRPGTTIPEVTAREFVEIHNTDATPVDLTGWAFTSGVSFAFPNGASIPAGGYVVVAADPVALQAAFGVANAFGPWTAGATLSNRHENIRLSKPGIVPGTMNPVDEVHYASEGNWAQRVREAQFSGWAWDTPTNGGGKSLELRNPSISNDNGQNWGACTAASGGTPGAPNSILTTNVAPIVHDVRHSPTVPKSTDAVTISCKLTDESAPASLGVTLFWRNATSVAPGSFQSKPMAGDGAGRFSTTLDPLPNLSIVEFYVSATDGTNTRTWPAPTSEGQNANCVYQVNNEVFSTNVETYLLLLTAAENAAFEGLATSNPNSDRQFNTTFIALRGGEQTIRYRTSMRIRGNSSRSYQFKPLRISLPLDDTWEGISDFNLNPKATHLQFIGFRCFQLAGVRGHDATSVFLRRNGVNSTTNSGGTPDFGRWVRVEEVNGDMTDHHWPEAKGGNIYKKGRGGSTDGFWRATQAAPATPDGTIDGWTKQNNSSANDWSDLRTFFQTWQAAAAPHFPNSAANNVSETTGMAETTVGKWDDSVFTPAEIASVSTVADLDQWARWFAVMTILQDIETNISNGQDDDYNIYFAPGPGGTRRLNLIAHDLDTIFGLGDTPVAANGRGLYDATDDTNIFRPLLPLLGTATKPGNAEFRTKYHTALRELYGGAFNADTTGNPNPPFYAFIDNELSGWAPAATRTAIKTFATARQTHLLGLIGSGPIAPTAPTSSSVLNSPHGSLMISEVLARNVAAHANGGTFPDVIELYNSGASAVDLSGVSLSDDPALPAKYTIPSGTIAAGGYLLIFADTTIYPPGLHTGFALDQDGDEVRLYDSGGVLLDSVAFGPQAADLSISRTGPTLTDWALTAPTLGAVNGVPVALGSLAGVRINEVFTNPDYIFADDFAELYNPGADPVALGGVTITDDPINYPIRHVLPPLSFIGRQSFILFRAKGGSASTGNPTELPFNFSAYTGVVAIVGANGALFDQFDTAPFSADGSRGRSPDGAATIAYFTPPTMLPTPGAPNVAPPAGILALMNQLRITEMLYKPNELEYVELQNIGSTPLDLSGVRFTEGIDYTFLPGTTLAPSAYIVVCKDQTAFEGQFGTNRPLAPGVFTGALDNSGETIALQPPPPWDVNILRFRYEIDWYDAANNDRALMVPDPQVALARDWNEKETWLPSPKLYGDPGAGLAPIIGGTLTASGILTDPFSYQISATRFPLTFTATGLPGGLSVNPSTGLISGAPTETGNFLVTIGAANPSGSDSDSLIIVVAETGPVATIAWDPIGASQTAGTAFTATLRAKDAQGRTVPTYNTTAQISAYSVTLTPKVLFTEVSTNSPDYFEIQNVGSGPADTTGWFIVTSRSTGVNAANTTTWDLPASLTSGQICGASDNAANLAATETYYGVDIDWPGQGPNGWIMLVDNTGTIRDFVAWGYNSTQLATISVTRKGFPLSVGSQWVGNGIDVLAANQSFFRTSTDDHNNAADWSTGATPSPRGTQNAGLNAPLAPIFAPLTSSHSGPVNLVNGQWSAPSFTVLESAALAELQADVSGEPAVVRSAMFSVAAPSGNTPPVFVKGANQTVNEDSGPRLVPSWATGIRQGVVAEAGQTVSFLLNADEPALFAVQPAINGSGALTFTPAANAYGTAVVSVVAKDNGGTANGGVDTSPAQTFSITIQPVNDAPVLTVGPNVTVLQNAGAQSIPWATNIGPGPTNEATQTAGLTVVASNPALFSAQPSIAVDGTLTFTPSPNRSGTTNVTINLSDDGGTTNGGVSTAQRTFSIEVKLVNDVPAFTAGPNLTVPCGLAFSQAWATQISPGVSPDEAGQGVNFVVTTNHPEWFKVQPAISPTGVLSFTSGKIGGTATLTVQLKDNAGTANGGVDTSPPVQFTVELISLATAAGKYRALLQPPGAPTHANSGLAEFALTAAGKFTGKVKLGGRTYAVAGAFDGSGVAKFGKKGIALPLVRKGLPPLTLSLNLDLLNPERRITGQILEGASPVASILARRDVYNTKTNLVPISLLNPTTDKGSYTAAFPALPAPNAGRTADQYPQGDGWSVLKVTKGGTLTMRGQLADGTRFTYASGLNASNAFPLYVPLYKLTGAVAGTIDFNTAPTTVLEATGLTWFRPIQLVPKPAPYYPQGWSDGIGLGFTGSSRNLATEPTLLPMGNATLDLTGAGLANPGLSQAFTIGLKNKVTLTLPNTAKVAVKLKPTGEWTGSFTNPGTGKKTLLQGVILRHESRGAGFFLGPTQAGQAQILTTP